MKTSGAAFSPKCQLILFPGPRIEESTRCLVVAPHPDDAEIAAFGLYGTTRSAVVTVTGGESGGSNYRRFLDDKQAQQRLKSRLRVWDSLAVPLLAGVAPEHVANLGYFDGTLREMHLDRERRFTSASTGFVSLYEQRSALTEGLLRPGATPNWGSLVADLAHAINRFEPHWVVAPHPFLDAHPDHRFTTIGLIEAMHASSHKPRGALLYVNHPVTCTRWPFGAPWHGHTLPPLHFEGPEIPGFYSHPVSTPQLTRKAFALEAMHDLRRAPLSPTSKLDWGCLGSAIQARSAYRHYFSDAATFMRRGLKPREVFFVYPLADLDRLRIDGIAAEEWWQQDAS
jgi:LmbE family N-acetylglucosaminyl deacetylase